MIKDTIYNLYSYSALASYMYIVGKFDFLHISDIILCCFFFAHLITHVHVQ